MKIKLNKNKSKPAEEAPKRAKSTSLINRAAVRNAALGFSLSIKGGKFTRVSGDFLRKVETEVRLCIERLVRSHPSIGKTLK